MTLSQTIFALSPLIRYVAILQGRDLQLHERPDIQGPSDAETDRYEELLVNPTLVTLLQRRGELDCGGLDHVWIRYGHFWTGIFPTANGHVNVGLEPQATPSEFSQPIKTLILG